MKKLLLKIVLCATAMLALGGVATPLIVSAEEAQETAIESVVTDETENVSSEVEASENTAEIGQETDTDKWFEETLLPLVMQFGVEVGAFAFVALIASKNITKMKGVLDIALSAVLKSNEDNVAMAKTMAELKKAYEQQKEEHAKQMEEMKGAFVDALREIKENLSDKVTDAGDTLNKLLEVEKLAYGDNAALVSSGTARRIAEVVGYGKGKTEDEE